MKYQIEMLPRAIAELRSIVLWWADTEHRFDRSTRAWKNKSLAIPYVRYRC